MCFPWATTNYLIAFLYTFCFSAVFFCSFNTTTKQPSGSFFISSSELFSPAQLIRWLSRFWNLNFYWLWSLHTLGFFPFFLISYIMHLACCLPIASSYCFLYSFNFFVHMTFYLLHWFSPGNWSSEKTWIYCFPFKTAFFGTVSQVILFTAFMLPMVLEH